MSQEERPPTAKAPDAKKVEEGGGGGPPSPAPEPEPDPWFSAVDKYREASKWAIGAFAAIGALLAGTAPLAGIGNLEAGRRLPVVLGAALGLVGAGLAIAAHVATLAPRTVYWHEVKARRQKWFGQTFRGLGPLEDILASAAKRKSVLPAGIDSPAALTRAIENLQRRVEDWSLKRMDASKTPEQRKEAAEAEKGFAAELAAHAKDRNELMRVARFEKARTGFRVAFASMLVGSIFVGVGLGLLLYGLTDQSAARKARAEAAKLEAETAKTNAEAAKVRVETEGLEGTTGAAQESETGTLSPVSSVQLTAAGQDSLAARLGAECDATSPIPVVLLSGDSQTGSWDVIVVGDTCAPVRFSLTQELGSLAG